MEERLKKTNQTNRISRISFVGREEFVLEIGNLVGEIDKGREKGGGSNVYAWMNRRKVQYPTTRPVFC